jgi:hypothetical protein
MVKKLGKFRTDMNIANELATGHDQKQQKKGNSIISPDMKTTQISPFKVEELGGVTTAGVNRQLDQIPEGVYDSDSSEYSCILSSLMGANGNKATADDAYEINNDYSIFRQRGPVHRFHDIDKPLKITPEETKHRANDASSLPNSRIISHNKREAIIKEAKGLNNNI